MIIKKKGFYKVVSDKNIYTKEQIAKILNDRIDEFNNTYYDIEFSDVYDNTEKQYYLFYYNILVRELKYLIEEVF